MQSRESMLEAAIATLATGDPAAVSGNRIARDIGATWSVVKYQFGDIDGLWAAVLHYTADKRGDLPAGIRSDGTLHERVTAMIAAMAVGLRKPESLAIETLRAALPRDHAELERDYPLTAAELACRRTRVVEAELGQGLSESFRRSRARPGQSAAGSRTHPGGHARNHLRTHPRHLRQPR
jgi:DNA-binding transcriptional regulator YbjK